MITSSFVKGYAVIKSKWVDSDILDTYLPFIATIIFDENMESIDENIISQKIQEKYSLTLHVTFIRQVLSHAMQKGLVQKIRELYVANREQLQKYAIKEDDFNEKWTSLIDSFYSYSKCDDLYKESKSEIENNILLFLEKYDDRVLFNNIDDISIDDNRFLYHWCKFILEIEKNNGMLYEFVLALCSANLFKNTLFYAGDANQAPCDVAVYLDTPMVFALLGMDTPERKEAYTHVINTAKTAGMKLFVFDHNLEEINGIMERASKWATSNQYDSATANKVAEFFHDSEMDETDIVEYIGKLEEKLNALGIVKDSSFYLSQEDSFQLDEKELSDAIKEEYGRRALKYRTAEMYENSISVDVRSIVMIERKRSGFYSTCLNSSKYLFISTNGAIAKVSKDHYSQNDITKDKIPTCITVDIFGTLLWFNYPQQRCTYTSLKLLADCKAILQPSSTMIAQLNKQLDEAYKRRDITEDTFLFMRSHPIVRNKLLDATSGDYSAFTDHTWRDVYSLIKSHAQFEGDKKYEEEKAQHEKTKEELKQAELSISKAASREQELNDTIAFQNDKYSSTLARIVAVLIYAVPYLIVSIGAILIQNSYVNWTIKGIVLGALTVIVLVLFSTLFKKLEQKLKLYFLNRISRKK